MPSLSPLALLSAALLVLAVLYQSQLPPSPPASHAVKLTYFDGAGRAEASRVAFRLGGVTFDDERLARDAFLQLKPTLPYGQVPVVTVDGETLAESQAILRFAGRLGGSYPFYDALAMLLTEETLSTIDEISETKIGPVRREKDPQQQKLLQQQLVATALPTALELLERRLETISELPYFKNSDRVWLHEIGAWRFLDTFKSGVVSFIPADIADAYTTMNAIHAKVTSAQNELSSKAPTPSSAVGSALPRPSKLKVTYFNFPGRAEFIRLALTVGGIPFEDERLSHEEFRELKPSLPYGQVPVITVDGHVVAQSFGLLRYAGALGGLYPTNDPATALKIDEIIARAENLGYLFTPSSREQDQDKKRSMREELAADALPKALAALNKRVAHWKKTSTFVFGDELTVADLAIFQLVQSYQSGNLDYIPATLIDEHDALLAISQAVLEHPRVVEWYANAK